uniref:Uncharacterized protein n=1 Tax=Arundo donax TaxID=35708 RepID=A0A0A8YU14_ARUDO
MLPSPYFVRVLVGDHPPLSHSTPQSCTPSLSNLPPAELLIPHHCPAVSLHLPSAATAPPFALWIQKSDGPYLPFFSFRPHAAASRIRCCCSTWDRC